TIVGENLEEQKRANEDGEFEVMLPAGKYDITVDKAGYRRFMLTEVKIEAGGEASFTCELSLRGQPEVVGVRQH
ncbi:MAG: carboxypeptidase regulatory-like domain-containing protein, partial [Anaerolineae bacterium]|nr:carboxypeptidase regulatory-like domain-containing protein [Anaerolineae bacterium]